MRSFDVRSLSTRASLLASMAQIHAYVRARKYASDCASTVQVRVVRESHLTRGDAKPLSEN